MDEKHVVTCFLQRNDGRVLIMRRSEKVGTYRGKWGAVAGYLEKKPVEQAYTEIKEETGLERYDVFLVREGKSVIVVDEDLNRKWIVHPFLFYVETPGKVKIDWEHVEIRWVLPEEIKEMDTVPGLYDAYLSVSGEE